MKKLKKCCKKEREENADIADGCFVGRTKEGKWIYAQDVGSAIRDKAPLDNQQELDSI